jgi:hypothetical protein
MESTMALENESVMKNVSIDPFLCAWKQGVLAVGPQYFGMRDDAGVEGAMDKRQLTPDKQAIEQDIDAMDKWRRSMLIAMVGFYNDAWALSLQNATKTPVHSIIYQLDAENKGIFCALLHFYEGW